ncbi:hypothetical protein VB152_19450 [Xanthomonas fragariae]|nr:hypothetical protein [Xanthomonas fragariae]
MSENCQKPAFSVANTGSFGTPVQTSRPCGRWVVWGFSGATRYLGIRKPQPGKAGNFSSGCLAFHSL